LPGVNGCCFPLCNSVASGFGGLVLAFSVASSFHAAVVTFYRSWFKLF